jgi:cold shock CspA family protein
MISTGTIKSFNRSKGYGFIRMEPGGREVFFHRTALATDSLAELRKGLKISFEVFDNQGRAAAKNLRISDVNGAAMDASEHQSVSIPNGFIRSMWRKMSLNAEQPKRTPITRSDLESTIADSVRGTDPQCGAFVGVIVERIVPKSPQDANWAVKGVKYGRADRERCGAAILSCVEERQREFEVSD